MYLDVYTAQIYLQSYVGKQVVYFIPVPKKKPQRNKLHTFYFLRSVFQWLFNSHIEFKDFEHFIKKSDTYAQRTFSQHLYRQNINPHPPKIERIKSKSLFFLFGFDLYLYTYEFIGIIFCTHVLIVWEYHIQSALWWLLFNSVFFFCFINLKNNFLQYLCVILGGEECLACSIIISIVWEWRYSK